METRAGRPKESAPFLVPRLP